MWSFICNSKRIYRLSKWVSLVVLLYLMFWSSTRFILKYQEDYILPRETDIEQNDTLTTNTRLKSTEGKTKQTWKTALMDNVNVQHKKELLDRKKGRNIWSERQNKVKNAFRHAWKGYVDYAWPNDELKPVSKVADRPWMDVGLTIIDALDTALIMEQEDIYQKALGYVKNNLKFHHDGNSNVFEVTIRVLGGLLSSFHMRKDQILLDRAVELGDILLIAFNSSNCGIPWPSVNFNTRQAIPETISTAEATTLQLEFKYLSFLTGNPIYWNVAQQVLNVILPNVDESGLVPIYINHMTGKWNQENIRLGSRGDSYYEYLAKQYLQTNQTESRYKKEWRKAVRGIRKHLLGSSTPNHLLFVGELPYGMNGGFSTKMDHLVCFLPGYILFTNCPTPCRTIALYATKGKTLSKNLKLSSQDWMDLDMAMELMKSCFEMYKQTVTHLSPELVYWNSDPNSDFKTSLQSKVSKDPFKSALSDTDPISNISNPAYALYYHQQGKPNSSFSTVTRHPLKLMEGTELDFSIHYNDGHNLLRPETVESLFILYRITRKQEYRDMGWAIFEAFEKWTRVQTGGYSSLNDVRVVPPVLRDKMESFFLGETLKYLYLLFGNSSHIPLDSFVFNTEAHPLPIFQVDESDFKNKLLWI